MAVNLLGVEGSRHCVLVCGCCVRRIHADEVSTTLGCGDGVPGARHELVRAEAPEPWEL